MKEFTLLLRYLEIFKQGIAKLELSLGKDIVIHYNSKFLRFKLSFRTSRFGVD